MEELLSLPESDALPPSSDNSSVLLIKAAYLRPTLALVPPPMRSSGYFPEAAADLFFPSIGTYRDEESSLKSSSFILPSFFDINNI